MNRAQRRGKSRKAAPLSKTEMATHHRLAIMRASTGSMTPEMVTGLLVPMYEALTSLMEGRGQAGDFQSLWKAMLFGASLAQRLHDFGNEKEQFKTVKHLFDDIAIALCSVESRYATTERYGLSGDEVRQLRDGLALIGELLQVTTRGHAVESMIAADRESAKKFGYKPAIS